MGGTTLLYTREKPGKIQFLHALRFLSLAAPVDSTADTLGFATDDKVAPPSPKTDSAGPFSSGLTL